MKDIADSLGVSVVTVSKVLRNHDDIGDETRERVLKRVKELNYQPNPMARALVTGQSFLVGLIVPDLLHPFFAEIATALSSTLDKKGYCLIISSSEESPDKEQRQIDKLLGRRLDALVIASCCPTPTLFTQLEKQNVPFIFIDRKFEGFPASFVGVDDVAVGKLATEHLIAVGCRHIAHVRGPETSPGLGRLQGYRQALAKQKMEAPAEYLIAEREVDVNSRQHGADAATALLKLRRRPDGIFCYNDPLAVGVIDAILDAGLRVPEDVAVIGCGNLHYNSSLRVPLSSVDQQSLTIGERAGKIVLSMLGSRKRISPKSIILDPQIVARASTQRRNKKRGQ